MGHSIKLKIAIGTICEILQRGTTVFYGRETEKSGPGKSSRRFILRALQLNGAWRRRCGREEESLFVPERRLQERHVIHRIHTRDPLIYTRTCTSVLNLLSRSTWY